MHSVVTLVKEGKLGRKTAAAKGILLSHRRKNNKTSDTFELGKVFEKHSIAFCSHNFFAKATNLYITLQFFYKNIFYL